MTTLSRFVCVATGALCIAAGAYTWYANRAKTPLPKPINETSTTSTRAIVNATTTSDLIHVTNPLPNQQIQSPLVVTGEARGSWFFEASFPVVLTDWDGKTIAQGIAQAKSDWMTNNLVPFQATIVFKVDPNVYSDKGSLILRRDNPSGLPQNDNALQIPVVFARTTGSAVACTQEARLCPNGSVVTRTGPRCEFTPCPAAAPEPGVASTVRISFFSSKEVSTKYCNGADMDSVGYQKTITVEHTTSTLEKNPTPLQIVKETLHAATTGMCQTVLDQLNIMEKDGTVTIPPIEGWAGVSITMCTCKPIVETNILRIPGMKKVVWG